MKNTTYSILAIAGASLSFTLPVPETIEEFDALAKKPGAGLKSAVDNEIYRGVNADVRATFCEELEKHFVEKYPDHVELKRKTKDSGRKKKTEGVEEPVMVYAEAELEYVKRALAVLGTIEDREVPVTEYQFILDSIMLMTEKVKDEAGNEIEQLLIRFDPSRAERSERGPKTVPKVYIKAAEQLIAAGAFDRFTANHGLAYTPAEGASEADILAAKTDLVARKIQALEEAERAKIDLANKYA